MEKLLLQNQILIMKSTSQLMIDKNYYNIELKKQLKEQIIFSETYLKNLA